MAMLRVVHYLNQFFAGIGAEDKADTPPGRKDGPAGPGIALRQALADESRVVATVYCGDNYAAERDRAIDEIVDLIAAERPDVVVAGPAFAAGRYGLACGEICLRVQERLGITAITGMHPDNPSADLYRTRVYIARTSESAGGMGEAVKAMARLALKLHRQEQLGPPQEEGYLPTGRRVHFFAEQKAANRMIDMLLRKLHGKPYTTEWAVPQYNRVPPAPPIPELSRATVAVITTGGVVPRGNPDRLESSYATKWLKYPIAHLADLEPADWETVHGGFNTTNVNDDPDRAVPLDALRALEANGVFGKLHDQLFTTVGNCSSIPTIRKFARQMVEDLRAAQVDGVILTAT